MSIAGVTYFRSGNNASMAWVKALREVCHTGDEVAPRGQKTLEIQHQTHVINMQYPVVRIPERKLQYRFLGAEAYWILSGDNRVATIAPYNSRIAEYSDDGITFAGAYGPPIVDQLNYVIDALVTDKRSRRAVLTTWRPNPVSSRDIPCTVAFSFILRDGILNAHVFMRSNDLWLGWVYDVFNFTMLACKVACEYNKRTNEDPIIALGNLYLTAASSHLYEQHFDIANEIISAFSNYDREALQINPMPRDLIDWSFYERSLVACRDNVDPSPLAYWRIRE